MGSKKLNKRIALRLSAYLYSIHNDKGISIRQLAKIYKGLSGATIFRHAAKSVHHNLSVANIRRRDEQRSSIAMIEEKLSEL